MKGGSRGQSQAGRGSESQRRRAWRGSRPARSRSTPQHCNRIQRLSSAVSRRCCASPAGCPRRSDLGIEATALAAPVMAVLRNAQEDIGIGRGLTHARADAATEAVSRPFTRLGVGYSKTTHTGGSSLNSLHNTPTRDRPTTRTWPACSTRRSDCRPDTRESRRIHWRSSRGASCLLRSLALRWPTSDRYRLPEVSR